MRPSQAVYIVKNGDTLADICQKYYGNLDKVEEICELNDIIDQDEIWVGRKDRTALKKGDKICRDSRIPIIKRR